MHRNGLRNMYAFLTAAVLLIVFYCLFYMNDLIWKNVTSGNGYTIKLEQKQVPLELFIEPSIVTEGKQLLTGEVKKLEQSILKVDNTEIILKSITRQEQELLFDFTTKQHMPIFRGKFLHNSAYNDDGSLSITTNHEQVAIHNAEGEPIAVGSIGVGPEADFLVGIRLEDIDTVANGFYVNYNGYHRYRYAIGR